MRFLGFGFYSAWAALLVFGIISAPLSSTLGFAHTKDLLDHLNSANQTEADMHEFLAKDGNKYQIELDNGEDIKVYDAEGQMVGSITMMHVNADDHELPSYYYIHT